MLDCKCNYKSLLWESLSFLHLYKVPKCLIQCFALNGLLNFPSFVGAHIQRLIFHNLSVYSWTLLNDVFVETTALHLVSTTL